jgi:multidrug efflux pump subunit AcrA (membrane-fusion protein)
VRGRISKRPILFVSVALTIGLLAGVGIGAASSEAPQLREEVDELEAELADRERDLTASEAEAAKLADTIDDALAEADELKQRAESRLARLDKRAMKLDEQAAELDSREQEVVAAEQTLESSTIPDGVWELGRDYEAGIYRAEGGGGCYWEKLESPSGEFDAIIANGGFNRNQTLTIDSPYFSTSGCGEWVKIG